MLGGKSAVVHSLHRVFEAPEPGAGIRALWEGLITSVLVLSLWGSQWSQARHSDTDPATNWAWKMGQGQVCPFPSSSDSEVGAAK